MKPTEVTWIATVSDGTTIAEHEGQYEIIPGERKPWVRLCQSLRAEGKHLTSLRLRIGDRAIHLPRSQGRFSTKNPVAPDFYSLEHIVELDGIGGDQSQSDFLDAAAHYEGYSVHFITQVDDITNAWVEVRDNACIAPSPTKKGA